MNNIEFSTQMYVKYCGPRMPCFIIFYKMRIISRWKIAKVVVMWWLACTPTRKFHVLISTNFGDGVIIVRMDVVAWIWTATCVPCKAFFSLLNTVVRSPFGDCQGNSQSQNGPILRGKRQITCFERRWCLNAETFCLGRFLSPTAPLSHLQE